jgi:FkbM family methyltransferase
LERNISLNNLLSVYAVHCAVTDRDGAQTAFYQAPTEHFGMGSLAPQFNAKPVLVSTRTLGSLLDEYSIRSVGVVKVDVEGFEFGVFQGAEGLLRSAHSPVVIFEFCDWAEERAPGFCAGDAQRLLQSWGCHLWRLADYTAKRSPLVEPITKGFETLVAQSHSTRRSMAW